MLPVDVETTERLPGGGVRNTCLESLWLADSKITGPALVAASLSAVAPNIEQIVSRYTGLLSVRDGKDRYQKRLKEVGRLVRQFALVRKQERTWTAAR